jgi:hypothetical protein
VTAATISWLGRSCSSTSTSEWVAKKSASAVGTSVWVADVFARTTNVDCSPSEHRSSNLAPRAFSIAAILVLADAKDRCVCSAP